SAEAGTPVMSVYQGRVVFADWLRGFGLMIIVDHGSGYMTLYGNAETLLKAPGDWVEGGEPVALAGNSGGQNQTGIYFEVREQGEAKDPASWLRR
ncbi:MAG: peptidoglycan DD-metalloendopeptidase family protein, partial [Pseudomonadota bacterium]|nr:peptidoglycan DD-metalloendopeptidase family protein [Pseudomonadota bacterium]